MIVVVLIIMMMMVVMITVAMTIIIMVVMMMCNDDDDDYEYSENVIVMTVSQQQFLNSFMDWECGKCFPFIVIDSMNIHFFNIQYIYIYIESRISRKFLLSKQ